MSYVYSKSTNFPSGIDATQLADEISASSIANSLFEILNRKNNVVIVFDGSLNPADKATLDGLVAAHIPDTSPIPTASLEVAIDVNNFMENSYTTIASITYAGPPVFHTLVAIWSVGYMDVGGNSFKLRLYNVTENNLVAEGIFTNTEYMICKFDPIVNQPTGESLLELQAKVTGGSTVAHIRNLTICYN